MGSTVLHVQDDDKFPLDSNLLATSQWQSIIISNIPNLSPTVATFFLYLFLLYTTLFWGYGVVVVESTFTAELLLYSGL